MDMHENKIKNAVNGITYSEDTRTRIWEEISQKSEIAEKDVRKRVISGKIKAAIALACAAVLIVMVNVRNGNQYGTQISVYAKNPEGGEERVVLSPGEQVELLSVETPAGYGYVVEVDLENADYTYEIIPAQESESSFTIYQEGEYIYWTRDQYVDDDGRTQISYIFSVDADKIQTDDGSSVMYREVQADVGSSATYYQYFQLDGKNVWINSEYVDNEELRIIIYNDLHEVSEEKTVRFENSDEGCSVVLTE